MKKTFPVHPFLFAVFPILFLASENLGQIIWHEVIPFPIAISLLACSALFIIFWLFLRNRATAALIASLLCFMFFFYGYFYAAVANAINIDTTEVDGLRLHHIVFPIWILLFLAPVGLIFRMKGDLNRATRFFNVMALVLVMVPVLTIAKREVKNAFSMRGDMAERGCDVVESNPGEIVNLKAWPDIYYIILDGYTTSQNLKDYFNYDISSFLEFLEQRKFYIASDSRSNYAQTTLSLSSSFRMDYIHSLVEGLGQESQDRAILFDQVRNSRLRNFVKSKGYSFVHLVSPFSVIADNPCADLNIRCVYNNEFLLQLVKLSALSPFEGFLHIVREDFRRGVLKTFTELENVAKLKGPKFVFAHIITPHPPYLFGPNGEPSEFSDLDLSGKIWLQKQAYADQITFLNKKLREIVRDILGKSENEPIIVFQADHGSFTTGERKDADARLYRERMGIFHAIRLPDDDKSFLYPSVTPVNSFRLIFNHYLDGDFEILEDRSYYSTYEKPFQFTDVTEPI